MKVLILHQHFKTPQGGGAIRSYYLAKALVDKGIHTVVITGHNEAKYRTENVDGIEVHYLSVPYDNRFGFSRRIYSFFQFVTKASRLAALHKDAHICYAISTPLTTGLAAMLTRRKYKIPYIFEVGDLWPDAPIQMGFIRNRLLQRALYQIEKSIYKRAESIVALSLPIRDAIEKKIAGKMIHVLPNMADTDFYRPEEKHPLLEEKYHVKRKFVVSYIGAIGVANGLDHFLDCAAASQSAGLPICFLMCGDGAMVDRIKAYANKLALQNFSFIPFQNREGVAEIMNITDANFISYQPVEILETGSPNKYFDGLAAGKLTIINFRGWIKDEVEKDGCGVYVNPELHDDFPVKVGPFLQDAAILGQYQHAARLLAEQKYSRRVLGDRYFNIVSR